MVGFCVFRSEYTYGGSSETQISNSVIDAQISNQMQSLTKDDATNFIANYDGSQEELQQIQIALSEAYENGDLDVDYYNSFIDTRLKTFQICDNLRDNLAVK